MTASFDGAIRALSADALRFVGDGQVLGLGSGRAAAAFVRSRSALIKNGEIAITAVPTSLQIKIIAEKAGIPLIESDRVEKIDVVFDGADQIDSQKYMIKGGGGALLRENILIGMAKKVVIMADRSKFVRRLDMAVPVEVHPLARSSATRGILEIGGTAEMRMLDRGYPFITENGNVVFDCDFGAITSPKTLRRKIIEIPGVIECGIFARRPDVIYKAGAGGRFEIIR